MNVRDILEILMGAGMGIAQTQQGNVRDAATMAVSLVRAADNLLEDHTPEEVANLIYNLKNNPVDRITAEDTRVDDTEIERRIAALPTRDGNGQ